MPKVIDQDAANAVDVAISTNFVRPDRPIVKARVVYLGGNPKFSLPMKGRILVESLSTGDQDQDGNEIMEETRKVTSSGFSTYSFATHDELGRRMESRFFMPASHRDPVARGKRFVIVEHPDHLWRFASMRGPDNAFLFKVFPYTPEDGVAIQDYFRRKAQSIKQSNQDFADITKGG